jgi:hypothetical protein
VEISLVNPTSSPKPAPIIVPPPIIESSVFQLSSFFLKIGRFLIIGSLVARVQTVAPIAAPFLTLETIPNCFCLNSIIIIF